MDVDQSCKTCWDSGEEVINLFTMFCCFFSICGTLHSVDQFLNIKMTDISVTDPDKYPHMVCIRLASAFSTGLDKQKFST